MTDNHDPITLPLPGAGSQQRNVPVDSIAAA